jgi:flagellar biosynthesis/type III secretory pathway protein FliH
MGATELFKEIELKAQEGQVGIAQELQGKYDEGFAAGKVVGFSEGQASIILPDPADPNKIYTQSDMDKLAEQVRGEKDAEYAPVLAGKDQLLGEKDAELAAMRLELETLKADFDAKVVNGAFERVEKIKVLAKDAVQKMAVADQPIAEATVAELDNA